MPDEAVLDLLQRGEYGVLSTVDAEGQPYGVPLNYVYMKGAIYFHCALVGAKLDNIATHDRVSFCVVGRTRVLPAEFSTEFESVIVFGQAAMAHGEERYQALMGLIEKYSAGFVDQGPAYIETFDGRTNVVKITILNATGKARPPGAV